MSSSDSIEDTLQLLRVEYLDTPTLVLTAGEAADLVDIDRATAIAALQLLEASGFLVLTPDGCFARSPDRLRRATDAPSAGTRRAV